VIDGDRSSNHTHTHRTTQRTSSRFGFVSRQCPPRCVAATYCTILHNSSNEGRTTTEPNKSIDKQNRFIFYSSVHSFICVRRSNTNRINRPRLDLMSTVAIAQTALQNLGISWLALFCFCRRLVSERTMCRCEAIESDRIGSVTDCTIQSTIAPLRSLGSPLGVATQDKYGWLIRLRRNRI